jgi:hypothetical protein
MAEAVYEFDRSEKPVDKYSRVLVSGNRMKERRKWFGMAKVDRSCFLAVFSACSFMAVCRERFDRLILVPEVF